MERRREKKTRRLKQEIARKRCLRRKLIQIFFFGFVLLGVVFVCGEQGVKLIRIRRTGKFQHKIGQFAEFLRNF